MLVFSAWLKNHLCFFHSALWRQLTGLHSATPTSTKQNENVRVQWTYGRLPTVSWSKQPMTWLSNVMLSIFPSVKELLRQRRLRTNLSNILTRYSYVQCFEVHLQAMQLQIDALANKFFHDYGFYPTSREGGITFDPEGFEPRTTQARNLKCQLSVFPLMLGP